MDEPEVTGSAYAGCGRLFFLPTIYQRFGQDWDLEIVFSLLSPQVGVLGYDGLRIRGTGINTRWTDEYDGRYNGHCKH
jgi:hypothetical protein